ncbi:MAG TPA: ATP-binding protein [Puia sp.]
MKNEKDIIAPLSKEGLQMPLNSIHPAQERLERELRIEGALEQVRAKTIAMQHSDELKGAAALLFQQVKALGAPAYSCGYNIWEKDAKEFTSWMSTQDGSDFNPALKIPLTEDANFIRFNESRIGGEVFYVIEMRGERMQEHYRYLKTMPVFREYFEYAEKTGFAQPDTQIHHLANFSHGNLLFITLEPCPEFHDVFKRFAAVFDQTYTRFLDLKKAEAQTRESQIELGLERVRTRAMAMQNSSELAELVDTVFKELTKLDFALTWCLINIIDESSMSMTVWAANPDMDKAQESFYIKFEDYPFHHAIMKGYKERRTKDVYVLEGQEKKVYDEYLFHESAFRRVPVAAQAVSRALEKYVVSFSFSNFGGLQTVGDAPLSDENLDILNRFGKVFDLTYTRFNDLEKAEAQARESQIQLALERVRAKTMAMQKSEELKDIIQVVYDQFVHLHVNIEHTGFIIDYKERDEMNIWLADRHEIPTRVTIPYFDCSHWNSFIEAKEKGTDFFTNHLDFEEKNKFYRDLFELIPGLQEETKEYYFSRPALAISTVLLENVGLYIENFSGTPYTEEENNTLMRFGKVFQQTYTRFLDLQKAEAQAMEATKRASVDRIRAEIASMRTTNDLERITPLIWNELTTIGVPFNRCGVFIMDVEKREVQTFLSTPEGKGIAASFHLPYHAHPETSRIVAHWQRKEMYRPHWDAAAFIDFSKILAEKDAITTGEKFLVENRPTDLYLHFLPFHQGMLYVGYTTPLSDEHLQLAQALADAFSTAYARYEDFKKLETAKEQIEKTLVDLRQTQAQLVQSEKMASLGELTAGIAHEIQNPLNFINNFSEINRELISEMKIELGVGNMEEATEIATQIGNNEEKILHHGKRADAIVKGMLLHSQSGTGKKEPTDINALADEYLRLAFHGLRAKDKSFNAAMNTDYDASIGLIALISQDIGRVLLNLYNNAFYAVHEKKKSMDAGYEPTVSVSTHKNGNKVEIRVKDNGHGIPQKVKDKIFQPFFTTKPTGQGTGLGLSLSYDIIKAHGGDIYADSKEGEFTEFTIRLNV